jgi:hypothetical protein
MKATHGVGAVFELLRGVEDGEMNLLIRMHESVISAERPGVSENAMRENEPPRRYLKGELNDK